MGCVSLNLRVPPRQPVPRARRGVHSSICAHQGSDSNCPADDSLIFLMLRHAWKSRSDDPTLRRKALEEPLTVQAHIEGLKQMRKGCRSSRHTSQTVVCKASLSCRREFQNIPINAHVPRTPKDFLHEGVAVHLNLRLGSSEPDETRSLQEHRLCNTSSN